MEVAAMSDMPRIIIVNAIANDDSLVWERIEAALPEMYVDPLNIKLGYFGIEGGDQIRPYMSTRWASDPDDMAHLVDHARRGCLCGCYAHITDVLAAVVAEVQQGPVAAVVIFADTTYGITDRKAISAYIETLRKHGTRLFMFVRGVSKHETPAFYRSLVEETGGAFHLFTSNIERVAERIPDLLRAIACYATGGIEALRALDNAAGTLLLEQLRAVPFDTTGVTLPDRIAVPRERE
jgi:hypothetical protein